MECLSVNKYTEKYIILQKNMTLGLLGHFLILYGIPEVQEVFQNLPGAGGFVVIEYEPILSHGDPIHARNYQCLTLPNVHDYRFGNAFLENCFLGKRYGHPNGVKLMRIGFPHRPRGGHGGSSSHQ